LDELSDLGAVWELLIAVHDQRPRYQRERFSDLDDYKAGGKYTWVQRWAVEYYCQKGSIAGFKVSLRSGILLQKFESLPIPAGRKDVIW
jgi:hypothetical protein